MCGPQRRCIVDAVTRHGDDVTSSLERRNDPQFLIGHRPRADRDGLDPLRQFLVTQGADSRSCERFTGIETRFRADRLRCCRIVTRDHDHTDPGSPALGNRLFDTRAKRILQSNKSKQLKIMLEMRSEEHTSELQSLMRISYAVFCLKKKT